MTLLDLEDASSDEERMLADYEDRDAWMDRSHRQYRQSWLLLIRYYRSNTKEKKLNTYDKLILLLN